MMSWVILQSTTLPNHRCAGGNVYGGYDVYRVYAVYAVLLPCFIEGCRACVQVHMCVWCECTSVQVLILL